MNSLIKSPKFWKISLILCLLTVFVLSALPLKSISVGFELTDKFQHAFEYFGVGICFMGYFMTNLNKNRAQAGLLTMFWGGLYAISDEIHQGFVGYFDSGIFSGVRQCDWRDLIADCCGLLIAVVVVTAVVNRYFVANNAKIN